MDHEQTTANPPARGVARVYWGDAVKVVGSNAPLPGDADDSNLTTLVFSKHIFRDDDETHTVTLPRTVSGWCDYALQRRFLISMPSGHTRGYSFRDPNTDEEREEAERRLVVKKHRDDRIEPTLCNIAEQDSAHTELIIDAYCASLGGRGFMATMLALLFECHKYKYCSYVVSRPSDYVYGSDKAWVIFMDEVHLADTMEKCYGVVETYTTPLPKKDWIRSAVEELTSRHAKFNAAMLHVWTAWKHRLEA